MEATRSLRRPPGESSDQPGGRRLGSLAGPEAAAGQLQCLVRPRPAPRTTTRRRSPRARAGTTSTEARLVARSSAAPPAAGPRAARRRGEHQGKPGGSRAPDPGNRRKRRSPAGSACSRLRRKRGLGEPKSAPPDSTAQLACPNRRSKRSLGVRGHELEEPAESERSTGVRAWKLRWRRSGEPVRRKETF